MSVAGRTLLIVFLAALGLAGIAIAIERTAGDASRAAWLRAVAAAGAGGAFFFVFQALARAPWARDSPLARAKGLLFIAGLAAVPFLARLGAGPQLVLLGAGAGYLATTLAVIVRRLVRFRAAAASPRRASNGA